MCTCVLWGWMTMGLLSLFYQTVLVVVSGGCSVSSGEGLVVLDGNPGTRSPGQRSLVPGPRTFFYFIFLFFDSSSFFWKQENVGCVQ